MESKVIFEEVKKRIDQACEDENFHDFDLSDLGFEKKDIDDGRLMHYNFKLERDNHEIIDIDFRSYDQSGPFQNLPDMNKFKLELIFNNEVIESYQNSFED